MRLANRIHETTSTTGTGNLTLTGAVDSTFATFASIFQIDERLTYVAVNATEVETGVGYLSGATTFVRESPDAGAPTNFTTAPQIFADLTARDAVDVGRSLAIAAIPRILGG